MVSFKTFLTEAAMLAFPPGKASEIVGMGHMSSWTHGKFKAEYESILKQAEGASRSEKKKLSAKLNSMFANSKNDALADFFERAAINILR